MSTTATALQYSQFVTALIMGAETVFAQPNSGQTKLQSVLSSIQAATQVGLVAAPNVQIAQWTALVNAEVAILNASGIFSSTSHTGVGNATNVTAA